MLIIIYIHKDCGQYKTAQGGQSSRPIQYNASSKNKFEVAVDVI